MENTTAANINRNYKLVINWNTLDQALSDSPESEIEQFVALARQYAAEKGVQFETIRDIRKSGFELHHLLVDENGDIEMARTEEAWLEESMFSAICDRLDPRALSKCLKKS